MFRRGLRRYGYYPEETVPSSVTVDWSFPINRIGHTAAKSTPRPTPDGETVLIAGDDGRIHAVRPTGEHRWERETGAGRSLGFHGTPAIADGTAYIGGYDGELYAVDIDSGSTIWHTRMREFGDAIAIGSSPAYVDGSLYLLTEHKNPPAARCGRSTPRPGIQPGATTASGECPIPRPRSTARRAASSPAPTTASSTAGSFPPRVRLVVPGGR